jgi:hypothetical protein
MTRVSLVALVASIASCNGSSDSGAHYAGHGFAANPPTGWQSAEVRGNVQFTSREPARAKHTIVIRAAEKPRELREGTPSTVDGIVDTTAIVLRALPKSNVASRTTIAGAELPGAVFSLSFVPRGLETRYRREHAVLVGKKRMFHVIYTAPADETVDKTAFDRIVTTLAEEG